MAKSNNEYISLAEEKKNDKYKGLYYRKLTKGKVYYMSYRDEHSKTVRRTIPTIPNMTMGYLTDYLSDRKKEVAILKKGIEPQSQDKIKQLSTLNEMYEYYIANHTHKSISNTKSRYKNHLQNEEFSTKLIKLITREELNQFHQRLKVKNAIGKNSVLTNKSINEIILLAIRIIAYAEKFDKYKGDNPFKHVDKLKIDNVKLKQMNDEDFKLFFDAMKIADKRYSSDINDYRIGYLFTLLALTLGAREQTILNIEIDKINFIDNSIGLYDFKNEAKYVGHIISAEIKLVIEEIINNNGFPNRKYLFCLRGTESRYKNYPKQVKRILDNVINSKRSPDERLAIRDFRNVFATRLINDDMNLAHIQNLLNHKTPTMTMRYAQMLDTTGGDKLKEIFGKIKM